MGADTLILMHHSLLIRANEVDRHLRPCASASSISAIATWLTDEEMRRDHPGWDGGEESRIGRADGYWVDTLPSPSR